MLLVQGNEFRLESEMYKFMIFTDGRDIGSLKRMRATNKFHYFNHLKEY